MMITEKQIGILQHSLGVDSFGQGRQYRNHFCAGKWSDDFASCLGMVELGWMTIRPASEISGGDFVFFVTDLGKRIVANHSAKPPKLTRSQKRYRDFLKNGDWAESFGAWLKEAGR